MVPSLSIADAFNFRDLDPVLLVMMQSNFWLGGTVALSLTLAAPAGAQSITAAPDGTGTRIVIDGSTYHIQGGTQARANLFHSFQALGLNEGEIANFLSNPSVTNILGRVTGGEPSMINGLIQVTGAHSNLYLMNPAGFVFGQGMSLNVGGDFLATTADRIAVGDSWFMSSGVNDYTRLVGTPNQFAFLSEQPGAILNFGVLNSNQTVSLMGGTILNEGAIAAETVTLAAVPGERLVRIVQPGMLLSLEIPTAQVSAGIPPVALPILLTGSETLTNRSAAVSATPHLFSEGDLVIAGAVAGQHIDLYAAGQVTPTDADLIEGDTRVIRFSETGENPNQGIFIDHRSDHPEALLYGAEAGTIAQIIERDENGISVISEQLAVISDSVGELDSVAIVAEGNEGNFWLGSEWIRAKNIDNYATQLQTWGEALTDNADLLLYSCFTALGEAGQTLVQSLAEMTGADVAASVDATGSVNYEANWDLEYSTISGTIEAENPFTAQTLMSWNGKLATRTVQNLNDTLGGGSLRDALTTGGYSTGSSYWINSVADGDEITFASNLSGTITLTNVDGMPGIDEIAWSANNLTLDGDNRITVDAGGGSRIFNINGNATIKNLAITNGSAGGFGGGIYHHGTGTLTISNSIITSNSAVDNGAGIMSTSNVSLIDSIISNNSASSNGGGIVANSITLSSSTLSGNTAGASGNDIYSNGGSIKLTENNGDFNLDLFASDTTVDFNSSGSITLVGTIQTETKSITLNSGSNIDITGLALTTNGGDITMNAGGNITAQEFNTTSTTASQDAGNITLTSTGGIIDIVSSGGSGSILAFSGTGDDAGIVSLNGALGIKTGLINTESTGGAGGRVTLESQRFVQIDGALAAAGSAGGSFFNNFAASISSRGLSSGGAITIRHGGNGLVPFIVGDVSTNGTSNAITAGTGFTISPTNEYLFSHIQPGIQILTNGFGAAIANDVAGSEPVNQYLDTKSLIEHIGHQLNAGTVFLDNGGFTWTLPGDRAAGGSLDDNLVLQELIQLDNFLGESYSELQAESESVEGSDENEENNEESIDNIRETFKQIQEQTGTVPALIYALSQPDALELIVVTPDNQLLRKVVPEANRETLLKTIRTFRRRITAISPGYQQPAQQLYNWLIRPVESSINNLNINTLVFAMGDGLRSIPLAALHDGEQFLVEKYSLGQIPSLSLTDSSYVPLHDANVLAMGASQFDQLNPLPAVPSELSLITNLKAGEQHLNQGFTWENLATQSRNRNFEIVHLATHAAFRAGSATNSYIQLWGDDRIGVNQLRELRWFEDPKVELLVLSACQTALGDPHAELGFAGLAVQAGVKSTLASLWQISDAGTMQLMSEFYSQLNHPEVTIKAEALRRAQLMLLRGETNLQNDITLLPELARYANADLTHPYYWSAFTLVGSPW